MFFTDEKYLSEGVTLSGFLILNYDCKRIAIPEKPVKSGAEGARQKCQSLRQKDGFLYFLYFKFFDYRKFACEPAPFLTDGAFFIMKNECLII